MPTALQEPGYRMTVEAVGAALRTDLHRGLTSAEAAKRLVSAGRNELASEPPVPPWRRFLAQFQDVLVILLLVATGISVLLWLYERETAWPYEALAIFAVVLLNAAMGFVQEARAEAAAAALRALSAPDAAVVRDGRRQRVPTATIVPGDLIVVEEGDTIPADARLVESTALQVSEAALTGESLPVSKQVAPIAEEVPLGDRTNMIFSGTAATYGRGRAIVTTTGMRTEMGRIAGLLDETVDETTPLQRELDRLGKRLGLVVVLIAAVMIGTILLVENVREYSAILDVLILGVALAVAAVPEGLPAVVTAVLAIGVQRMARRNAIVRHLAAVETLGSASVIASDKTGTLTRNEMTVRAVVTASGRVSFEGAGYAPEGKVSRDDGAPVDGALGQELREALIAGDRANNAAVAQQDGHWTALGDPTEAALRVAARKTGIEAEGLDTALPRVGEVPFSSERKRMSTVHEAGRERRLYTKGAPDVLLERCTRERVGDRSAPLSGERRRAILEANDRLTGQAYRTLGVAMRRLPDGTGAPATWSEDQDLERDLVFLGLIGMLDPPRDEARDAVRFAHQAGIRTVMITGDHPRTAAVIARELGMTADERALTGAEIERMSPAALTAAAREVSVYARVNPEHKLRIIDALRDQGHVVAMTGDGVNDAPALRKADIGIAMGITGSDVSKGAADIVLADDNFASIVAAVEEGRAIFANIRKFLRYLLSSNIGEVLTMFFGVLLADRIGLHDAGRGVVLPLVATQILWINLVTDGPPALALGLDPAESGLMRQPPRPPGEGVLTPRMWRGIAFVGLVMAVGTLAILDASLPGGFIPGEGDLRYGQTMAFTTLMLFQIFNVFNARSDRESAFAHLFTNRWLWGAVALSVALQVAVVYVPVLQQAFGTVSLTAADWTACLAVASSVLWLRELSKLVGRMPRPTPA
jgi:P-type Ca2+ transporter type 2C